MNQAFSCFPIMKDTIPILVQSWKNILCPDKGVLNVDLSCLEIGFYDFLAFAGYRRRRLVTAAPTGLASATCIKEVFLSFAS
jgi:hypothetical protein